MTSMTLWPDNLLTRLGFAQMARFPSTAYRPSLGASWRPEDGLTRWAATKPVQLRAFIARGAMEKSGGFRVFSSPQWGYLTCPPSPKGGEITHQ
jgi:hypothetical protein